jgi:hypothetical protein
MTAILRPRGLGTTRRRALLDLALGGGALATVAGCGEQAKAQLPQVCDEESAITDDRAPLSSALIMEWLVVEAYEALAGAPFSQEVKDAFALFGAHHAEHVGWAKTDYEAIGIELPERSPLPTLPDACFESDETAVRLALTLETDAVSSYVGVVKQITDPERRRVAAAVLATEMSHVMTIRAALAVPGRFDLITELAAEAFTDVTTLSVEPAWRICETATAGGSDEYGGSGE